MFNIKYVGEAPSNTAVKRIYFSCHPDDHKLYFDAVCNDIPSEYKAFASILYDEKPDASYDPDDYRNFLRSATFIIMPVTAKLISQQNRSRDFDFAFAVENNIPLLPIMVESGLEEQFNKTFGDLQLLDRTGTADTAESYKSKLTDYFKSFFNQNQENKNISSAFSGNLFLSYRQRDYSAAYSLMQLIHDTEGCRDISIWYDDFLVSGEDFNNSIADQIKNCDIFVLAITPNTLQKGNYVLEIEYPLAKKLDKPIFAVEMEAVDRDEFVRLFDADITLVDGTDAAAFAEQFTALAEKLDILQKCDSPQQRYLMGLAYFDGIDLEKNPQRALLLLESAHKDGYIKATDKLAKAYQNGQHVQKSLYKAAFYYRHAIDVLEEEHEISPALSTADNLIYRMITLSDLMRELHNADDMLNLLEDAEYYYYQYAGHTPDTVLWNGYLLDVFAGRQEAFLLNRQYQQAEECARENLEILDNFLAEDNSPLYLRKKVIVYHFLHNLYKKYYRTRDAEQPLLDAIKVMEKLILEQGTDFDRLKLVESYIYVATLYKSQKKLAEAGQYAQNAVFMAGLITQQDTRLQLISAYHTLCHVSCRQKNYEKAQETFEKAVPLFKSMIAQEFNKKYIFLFAELCMMAAKHSFLQDMSVLSTCIAFLNALTLAGKNFNASYYLLNLYAYGAYAYTYQKDYKAEDILAYTEKFDAESITFDGDIHSILMPDLFCCLGLAYYHADNTNKAVEYFELYFKLLGIWDNLSPENLTEKDCRSDALFYLTAAMIYLGNYTLAEKYARCDIAWAETFDKDNFDAQHRLRAAHYGLAYICYVQEMYPQALENYEKLADYEENLLKNYELEEEAYNIAVLIFARLAKLCTLLKHPLKAAKYHRIAEKYHNGSSRRYMEEAEAEIMEERSSWKAQNSAVKE